MKVLAFVFFAASLLAQSSQFTEIPPKPTCNPAALPLFGGGPDCQDRWNLYNRAVQQRTREELQNYVNRQKELASSEATAPLQQQIADLKKLSDDEQQQIKKLTEQIEADAQAKNEDAKVAIQAKDAAHTAGMEQGAGIGFGATLALVGIIFGIKKITANFTVTKKPQAKAASA